jgi:tetratricopeptide (TPR) repeat protein
VTVCALLLTAWASQIPAQTTGPSALSENQQKIVAQAQSHWSIALSDWARGQFELALEEGRTTLAYYRQVYGDQPNAAIARTRLGIGNCLVQLNRPAEAIGEYNASLAMYQVVLGNTDCRELATVMGKLGWCQHLLDQEDVGAENLKRAGEMAQRLARKQPAADLMTGLTLVATSLEAMDRAEDALPFRETALKVARSLAASPDDYNVAVQMDGIASCLSSLGRFAQALSYYQDAVEIGQHLLNGADSPAMAAGLEHTGDCLSNLGRYDEALQLLKESLAMRQRIAGGKDDAQVGLGMSMVAICLSNMGHFDEALKMHQAVLEMGNRLSGGKDSAPLAYCMEYVALDLLALHRPHEALPLLQDALAMRRRVFGKRDEPVLAESMGMLALNLVLVGRDKDALAMLEDATAMAERLRSPFLFMYYRMLGGLRLKLGDAAGSAAAFGKGIDSIEQFRNSLGGDDQDRMGAMNAYQGWDPYSGMVRAQLQLGHADSAAVYLDRGRARSLLDVLERGERLSNGDLLNPVEQKARLTNNTEELQEIADVRVALATAMNQMQQLSAAIDHARALNSDQGLAQIEQLQPKLAAAHQKYAQAHRREFNLAGRTTFTTAATAEEIQSLLGPHEHLLMYSLTPKDGVLLLIPPPGQAISGTYLLTPDGKERLSGQTFQKLISAYRHAIVKNGLDSIRGVRRPENGPTAATQPAESMANLGFGLFRALMPQSIWQQIQNDDRVYVVPDSLMSGLPLETLILKKPPSESPKDTVYWLDAGPSVCYGPSVAALLELRRQESSRTDRTYAHEAVLLGDPVLRLSDQQKIRQPVPSAGAYVSSVRPGSPAEAIGLRKDAVIIGYGPVVIGGKDQFGDAVDKLALMQFHGKLKATPKVKFWLDGQVMERELALDSAQGAELEDLTPALAANLTGGEPQPIATVAMRDATLTRYGALTPLPGTRVEVAGIYQVLTGHAYAGSGDDSVVVLLGQDATTERLAEAARGTRYLHLATHGLVEPGQDAIFSSLVLSQPETVSPLDTGMLTLQDLFDHWWGRLDGTELVVLSACDSQGLDANGSNNFGGDGVFGLPWGFMYAGSPAVVASLWEVQDESTAELMQKFYASMRNASSPGKLQAFTQARKELRKRFAEPFFWAPFIYLGNPN